MLAENRCCVDNGKAQRLAMKTKNLIICHFLILNFLIFRIFWQDTINLINGYGLIKCIGISTIYWNYGAFCGHCLGMPHGMVE